MVSAFFQFYVRVGWRGLFENQDNIQQTRRQGTHFDLIMKSLNIKILLIIINLNLKIKSNVFLIKTRQACIF